MASSFPSPESGLSAAAAPLPPINAPDSPKSAPQPDFMAAVMSGISSVKKDVDSIDQAARHLVQTGVVPGGEQICAQIIALAQSLLLMGAQAAMQPGMGGQGPSPMPQSPGGSGGGSPLPPGMSPIPSPPGAPQGLS